MSGGVPWLVASLAAVSVALALRPRPVLLPEPLGTVAPRSASRAGERALLRRLRPVLATIAFAGGWAMFGGPVGWVAGSGSAVAVWVVLGRTEDPAVVRRREQLLDDLPTGVDLLAACLDAGAAPESSLVVVSRALEGPVGEELLAIHHRLEVGVDPVQVWRAVAAHPQLGPLGRAIGRAHETGAPVGRAVHQLAEELRAQARADVETRARSIEVKAAAPLGLCLLPAFVVLGVVPMVVGVFSSMRLFW
jgi:Flp pilus assembly protein TadB